MPGPFYVGVDVGTASVRAGLVSHDGRLLEHATRSITIWNDTTDTFEQSSKNIWEAVCATVKMVTIGYSAGDVKGIGFDATCSLVVLSKSFRPVDIRVPEKASSACDPCIRDIIMWLDHRAQVEANYINKSKHRLLKFVGGAISLEMEMPKLRWIKNNHPKAWEEAFYFFDLPDFLTFKATGSLSRSLCSLVCKWAYDAENGQWDRGFLSDIVGIGDVLDDAHRIGKDVYPPGMPVGGGLSLDAARDLGLQPATSVGASMVDAHCGALGLLPTYHPTLADTKITSRLAMICGTSTCHMLMSEEALFVPGVWGPYASAILMNLHTAEGGQSATGKALDHVLHSHPAWQELTAEANRLQQSVHEVLEGVLYKEAARRGIPRDQVHRLAEDLHVCPEFHGNRSPLADPVMRGAIVGLSFDVSLGNLARLYLATIQGLVYGTLHIVKQLEQYRHTVDAVYVCGGLISNGMFVACLSDALDKPVVLPKEKETVLLGAAMLGMAAASEKELQTVVSEIRREGEVINPRQSTRSFHAAKYMIYLDMLRTQKEYREGMSQSQ